MYKYKHDVLKPYEKTTELELKKVENNLTSPEPYFTLRRHRPRRTLVSKALVCSHVAVAWSN